jgi:DHA1 family bicyclomycin/chloramphenicol resistance-like MFS transporter
VSESKTPVLEAPGLRRRPLWIATLLAVLTVFGPLSMDLYLPVLPALAEDLGSTASAAQLTMTTCLIGLAFGQLIAGPLSDRFGRRRPLLVGLVVYTAASALCAASPTIVALVVCRLVQGLAGGVGLVIAQAAGRDIYDGPRLTRFYGRIVVLSGLAAVVAPVVGGALASVMGWRGFFVVLTVIGVLVSLAVWTGFGETLSTSARVPAERGAMRRHAVALARDRLFVGATVSSALTSAAYFAYLAGAPFLLQHVFELVPTQYALVFGVNAAGFAAAGFTAGRTAERWSERGVFAAGLVVIGLGGVLLGVTALSGPSLPLAMVAFFLVSAGAAAVSPPSTTLALVDHPQRAGTASSVLGLARFAAGGVAAPLVGLGGDGDSTALAVVVLVSSALATVVFCWLVRGRSGPVR